MRCEYCDKELQYGYEDYQRYNYCDCDTYKEIENKKEEIRNKKQELYALENELECLKDKSIYRSKIRELERRYR